MPISTVVDHVQRRLVTRVTGSVKLSEVRQHIDRILSQGIEGYRELIDARGATRPLWTVREISKIPGLLGHPHEHNFGWRAIVVDGAATFALARLFATLAVRYVPTGVFYDLAQAETWLARSDEPHAEDLARDRRRAAGN